MIFTNDEVSDTTADAMKNFSLPTKITAGKLVT